MTYTMYDVSERFRVLGEIVPDKVEQSKTYNDDIDTYSADFFADLDWGTNARAVSEYDGLWLRLTFNEVHCIHQVSWWDDASKPFLSWTCSKTDCSKCDQGDDCTTEAITTSVLMVGETPENLPSLQDCKYGNVVELLYTGKNEWIEAAEIVVTENNKGEKNGNSIFQCIL